VRDIDPALQEELQSRELTPFLLYEGEFETGTVRLWTGIGTLEHDSVEWTGAGTWLSMSTIEEATEIRATGWSVSLSGVSQEAISLAIDEAQQGAKGTIYFGCLNDDLDVVAVTRIGRGKLDVPTAEEDGEEAVIQVSYESDLVALERPRETRYTNESQQARFPGDKFFEHVSGLQQADITWGRPSPS